MDRRKITIAVIAGATVLGGAVLLGLLAGWFDSRNPNHGLAVESGLTCLIVNKNSGRCLGITEAPVEEGEHVVQGVAPEQASDLEHWRFKHLDDDRYKIVHVQSGLVLEIGGAKTENGGLAILWADGGTAAHQIWNLTEEGNGYTFTAEHSKLALGVGGAASTPGAAVLQWDRVPAAIDQVWILLPLPGSPQ